MHQKPWLIGCFIVVAAWLAQANASTLDDPFHSAELHVQGSGYSQNDRLQSDCLQLIHGPMTLVDVVNKALCNNPQTRLAWANVRAQAALIGVAQSAYLPTLSFNAGKNQPFGDNSVPASSQTSSSLSAGFLLYDFGTRAANLENARQMMSAMANAQDSALQTVFLAAVQAYYQWHAVNSSVVAAREAERASAESLRAAQTRYRIGTGTPSDRLQAQTALSQAILSRIQAEGNAQSALAGVANVMGIDAQDAPALADSPLSIPSQEFENDLNALITQAKQDRSDLLAAQAQVKAAQAAVEIAQSSGMPSLFMNANNNYQNINSTVVTRSYSVGLTLTVPIFTGFNTTYRIRNAQALLDAKSAQLEQVSRQVSLDVWKNYYALRTAIDSVHAANDLQASAEESEKVALGRYKAGAGGILDLLNAQTALVNARQQFIQSLYNWQVAKAALAQSIGRLGYEQITESAAASASIKKANLQ